MSIEDANRGQEEHGSLSVLHTRASIDEQRTPISDSSGDASQSETFVTANSGSRIPNISKTPTISSLGLPLAFSLINSGINSSQYFTAKSTLSQLRAQQSPTKKPDPLSINNNNQASTHKTIASSHYLADDEGTIFRSQEDELDVSQITHEPPFLPVTHSYARFGKSNLRQSIISRQSNRIVPIQDRLTDHMEEQMVRWRAPPSSYQAEDILNGNHPYQSAELAKHELLAAVAERSEPVSIFAPSNIDTDSAVNSIARSPFVNVDSKTGASLVRNHRVRATFREHNDLPIKSKDNVKIDVNEADGNDAIGDHDNDNDSIQESLRFNLKTDDNSASTSSSIIKKLNQNSTSEDDEKDRDLQLARCSGGKVDSARTVDAEPINREDLERLAKDDPEPLNMIRFNQHPDDPPNPYGNDDRNQGGWAAFAEGCQDIWKECIDIWTCNCTCDDDLDPRVNPYSIGA